MNRLVSHLTPDTLLTHHVVAIKVKSLVGVVVLVYGCPPRVVAIVKRPPFPENTVR